MSDGKIVIETDLDSKGLENSLSKLGSISKKGAKTVVTAIASITAAIGGVAAASINVGVEFESSMSQVAATMGITAEEIANGSDSFELLKKAAKDAGSTTQFSASQSASALNFLALAGYDAEKAVSALPTVLNLAAAGGLDLAYASDLVTDSMSSLGLETSQLEGFVDQLAKTSQKSNTSVGQLGEAILTVGGTAKVLAGGTTELNSALAILADNGVKGAEGGTALRNIILSLSAPTDVAAKQMERLGLKVFDAQGNMRPLNDIFKDLDKTLSKMTQGEQTRVLSKLFNKVDLKSVNALLANSGERFDELSGYISNADGAAAAMAETMNDNLKGRMTQLSSALEGLGIDIYEQMELPLKSMAEQAIESVGKLHDTLKNNGLDGLVTEVGEVLADIVKQIANSAPKFIDLSLNLIDSFIKGISDNLPSLAKSSMQIIDSLINGILTLLPDILNIGLQILITLGQGISENLPYLIPDIVNLIISICDNIIENLPMIISVATDIILALIQGLVSSLPTLIAEVPRIINSFSDAIYSSLPQILEAGVQILLMLIEGLIQSIPILVENIPQIIMAIVNAVTLYNWAGLGKNVINWVTNGISSMKGNIGNVAKGVAEWVGTSITNIFKGGLSWGKNLISNIGQGFSSMVSFLGNSAKNVATSALNKIKNIFSSGFDIGKNLIQGIWNGISNMKQWILDKIGGFAGTIINGIKGFFDIHSPSRVMRDLIGVNIVKGIGVGIDIETPNLNKNIDTTMQEMTNRMQMAIDTEQIKIAGNFKLKSNYEANSNDNNNNDNSEVIKVLNSIMNDIRSIDPKVFLNSKELVHSTISVFDELNGKRQYLAERGLNL